MDHFNVSQLCQFCARGSKVFKVELDCYNAEGALTVNPVQMLSRFYFQCEFFGLVSTLDFCQFSHLSIILHMKREKEKNDKIKKLLQELYVLLNE